MQKGLNVVVVVLFVVFYNNFCIEDAENVVFTHFCRKFDNSTLRPPSRDCLQEKSYYWESLHFLTLLITVQKLTVFLSIVIDETK